MRVGQAGYGHDVGQIWVELCLLHLVPNLFWVRQCWVIKGFALVFWAWASIVWGPERSVGLSYPPGLAFGPGMANPIMSL